MKNLYPFFWMLLMVVSLSSCESNDDNNSSGPNDDTFSQNFGNAVNRDFIGQIVDADDNPIPGVTVEIGSSSVQTDVNGVFIINGAAVHEKFAYVKATKTGYLEGSRSMVPTSGKNNVRIMLIPNAPLETIESGEESEVAMPNGTKVVFDGAFEDENGNNYTGAVQVTMFHLLPSNENISKIMPGMLYAQTETNEEAVLETFGMLNVELRGSGGQKLNIKNGHTAEITMQIDNNQLATAPNTIPLWHFDEERGYWKQDGEATKVGNKYVGEVSHFSWWNCDAFSETVSLTVNVIGNNGILLTNVGVQLIANSNGLNSYVQYTNESGQVSGIIPAGQMLTLNLILECGVVYTTTIGPFSSDTILPPIAINSSANAASTHVKGKLSKCDNTTVTNGYVILNMNGKELLCTVTNGMFSFDVAYCSGNTAFALEGVDFDSFQRTGRINYNFQTAITDVGELLACNSIDEFVLFKYDNEPQVTILSNFNSGFQTLLPNYFLTANEGLFSLPGLQLYTASTLPGTYSGGATVAHIGVRNSSAIGMSTSSCTITINKYGDIGDYIDMTFSGTGVDAIGVVHTVTGVAHIKRVN